MTTAGLLRSKEISGGLWQQLNIETLTTSGTTEDCIGLEDVVGFDILRETTAATRVCKASLSQNAIDEWLERGVGAHDIAGSVTGKVLIANQVMHQDGLCPPTEAAAVRFSRKKLCRQFGLPSLALNRISRPASWYMSFPGYHRSCWKSCEGLGASRFGFLSCMDQQTQTFCVLLVFYRAVKIDNRERIERDLETLTHLANNPALMPYLILQLIIGIESAQIAHIKDRAEQAEDAILRQTSISEVRASHARAYQLAAVSIDATNGLKMAHRWANINGGAGNPLELQHGIDFSRQMLNNIVEASKRSEAQSTRQLTTVLSMLALEQQRMSREDQQLSISIADASKSIAEETKKDGTSMKTLAVVTMLFLPATSVSSIFSMPLFDWEEDDSRVVRPAIWVYFVFATLLTILTVGTWWIWQRRLAQHRQSREADKSKLC